MKMNVHHKIRKVRELKGFSQEYIAQSIGISQKAYSNLEKGDSAINIARIEEIAEILDVDPLKLLSFDESIFFNNSVQSHFSNTYGKDYKNEQNIEDLVQALKTQIKQQKEEIIFLRRLVQANQ